MTLSCRQKNRFWAVAGVAFALVSFNLAGPNSPGLSSAAAETDTAEKETPAASPEDEAALKQKHAEYLRQMRERVSAARIHVAGIQTEAELVAEPLMRFNNQSLRNVDATLWGWTSAGRLVGVCKLIRMEKFRPDEGPWLYCFTSLSPGPIDAEFGVGPAFSSEKPGIELQKIEKAPIPANGKAERLRQMKDLASRFTATTTDYADRAEELRLLPRPIYRYQLPEDNKPDDGALLDGAVFAMSIEGTAPTVLVLIELHHRGQEHPNGNSPFRTAPGPRSRSSLTDARCGRNPSSCGPAITTTGRHSGNSSVPPASGSVFRNIVGPQARRRQRR
jgi:hypothetical protein